MIISQLNCLNSNDQALRTPKLLEALFRENPQIITLQEVVSQELKEGLFLNGYQIAFSEYGAGELVIAAKGEVELLESLPDEGVMAARVRLLQEEALIFSAHLAWGGDVEQERLRAATLIDDIAKESSTELQVLGGDLNANPDSRTVRYLTGLDLNLENESTLWLDSFKEASKKEGEDFTTLYKSQLGVQTAKSHGVLRPEQLPDRRIDYLLVRGWRYGKLGYPLSYENFGEGVSDHLGVTVKLQRRQGKKVSSQLAKNSSPGPQR